MEALSAIEQLGAVRLLKSSFYAYPLVNALHIAAIGALFTSVWLMDLRVLGAFRTVPEHPFLALMRRVAISAFAGAALTGAALFSIRATEYAGMPVFWAKMGLILLAGLNLLLFAMLARKRPPQAPAGSGERLAASLSALLWTGVLLCGRFIGFA